LISLVRDKNNGEAFQEVCRRYENIFYKVCQKYVNALSHCGVNVQDIFDEKVYIIYHCINTFNPKKNTKLSTWIGNYARYLCLNSINSRKFILPTLDDDVKQHIEEMQISQSYMSASFSSEDYNYILNIIGQLKDRRVSEIFKYRYFAPKKMIWSKIAKRLKISTQTAINLHNKGIHILRKKVKSKNISDIV
jgi:RNA polymerase sigma factor (sigma-70 family)